MFIEIDLIQKAFSSRDHNELEVLSQEKNMYVRKAVARNNATPSSIINRLAYDPTSNVVYFALNHPNCTVTRKLRDKDHPCVQCNIIEDISRCHNCEKLIF